MNEKQRKLLEALYEMREPADLTALIKKHGFRNSSEHLSFWGVALAHRFGYSGIAHLPEWLRGVLLLRIAGVNGVIMVDSFLHRIRYTSNSSRKPAE